MPFQSEKQRRYLWANEPKIARDWADTYGSRIEKNDGGISQLVKPGPGRPGYGGSPHDDSRDGPGSSSAGVGGGTSFSGGNQGSDHGHSRFKPGSGYYGAKKTTTSPKDDRSKAELKAKLITKKNLKNKDSLFTKLQNKHNLWARNKYINSYIKKNPAPFYKQTGKGFIWDEWDDDYTSSDEGLEALKRTGYLKNTNQGGGGDGGYKGYGSYEAWLAAQNRGTGVTEVAEVVEDTPSAFQESLTGTADTPDYYVGNTPLASNTAWGQAYGVDPRTMGRTSWAADGGRIPAAFGGIMDRSTGRRAYGFGSIFKSIKKAASKVLKSDVGKAALMAGVGYIGGGGGMPKWMDGKGLGGFSMGTLFSKKNPLLFTGKKFSPWKGIGLASALPFFMGGQEEDEDEAFDYDAAKQLYADKIMNIKRGVSAGTLNPEQWSYLPSDYKYTGAEGGRAGYYAGGQSIPSPYTMEDARKSSMQDKMGGITDVMKRADLSRQGDVGQMYAADGGRIGYIGGGISGLEEKIIENPRRKMGEEKIIENPRREMGEKKEYAPLNDQSKFQNLMLLVQMFKAQGMNDNDALKAAQAHFGAEGFGRAQGGRIGYAHGSVGYPPVTTGQVPQAPPQMPTPPAPPSPMPAPQPNRMVGMNPMMGGMNPMGGMPRRMAQEGGLMDLGGMEKDYRNDGGFVPLGGEEKADDVPARLSKNEFVFTADAVRGAGGGDIDKGAEIMENMMTNLEQGGQISKETQGLGGAQEMFDVSERIGEVI